MSEDRKQIETALDRLTTELMSSTTLDPATAERWQSLLKDLRRALDSGGAAQAERNAADSSLTRRVSEATLEFEATHPTLAGTLGSIIDALGRMGI